MSYFSHLLSDLKAALTPGSYFQLPYMASPFAFSWCGATLSYRSRCWTERKIEGRYKKQQVSIIWNDNLYIDQDKRKNSWIVSVQKSERGGFRREYTARFFTQLPADIQAMIRELADAAQQGLYDQVQSGRPFLPSDESTPPTRPGNRIAGMAAGRIPLSQRQSGSPFRSVASARPSHLRLVK